MTASRANGEPSLFDLLWTTYCEDESHVDRHGLTTKNAFKAMCKTCVGEIALAAAERERERCAKAIPTNWCDPMFVDAPKSLHGPSVEWALQQAAAAIRALGEEGV